MKPEDRKRLKQHIEMIVEHKTTVEELEDTIRRLRVELHTLRFKESQEQRFIWWVRNVYSKNVMDTIAGIMEACTYQDEPTAAAGKYGLPIKCFEMMRRLTESTHGIYDGTYITHQVSTDVKKGIPENKPAYRSMCDSIIITPLISEPGIKACQNNKNNQ